MKTYFRILNYIRPYWKHLSASIIFSVLQALLNGASIYLAIPLLDTLFQQAGVAPEATQNFQKNIESKATGWLSGMLNDIFNYFKSIIFSGDTSEVLFKICILIIIAFLGKNMFGYLQSYYMAFVEQGMIRDLRNDSFRHLHKLPMSYFKNEKNCAGFRLF